MTSYMFEVYYRAPRDSLHEEKIIAEVAVAGGRLEFIEELRVANASSSVVLTFEFDEQRKAEDAAARLRRLGEHVEGSGEYG